MAPTTSSASKGKQKAFRIEPTAEWYNIAPALETPAKSTKPPNATQLSDAQTRATTLHADMLIAHTDITKDSSSDGAFLQKVLQGGTLSDRLSALTLLVQASPLHNMKALDALKSMAERGRGGGRDQSLKALRCIVDWWTGGGAPTRKLK
jgi:ribosome biogenesis protein MAK21